jgi:uncharacterized protein
MSHIISQFKTSIQQLYGERLSKIILFGSYARGEEKEYSDIDFLIVLKDKNISVFNEIERINNQVYSMILNTGKLFPLFLPLKKNLKTLPIISTVW